MSKSKKHFLMSSSEQDSIRSSLFNTNPLPMWIFDLETFRFLEVNRAAVRKYGYTRNEFLKMKVTELRFPEDLEAFVSAVAKVNASGFESRDHWRHRLKRGEIIDVEVFAKEISFGRKRAVLSIIYDLTREREIERDLKESLEWQTIIFEGSRDAIFISNAESRFVSVNEAACELTGYTKPELLSMKIPDLHEEMDLDVYNKFHERIIQGEPALTEALLLREDGTKIAVEFNSRRVVLSGSPYMHTIARDITLRKKAEGEHILHDLIFKNLSEIVLCAGRKDMRIIDLNKAAEEAFGYSHDELLSMPLFELLPHEARPGLQQRLIEGSPSGTTYRTVSLRKDGSRFPVEVKRNMFMLDGEEIILGIGRDLTESKRAEAALQASEEQMRAIVEGTPQLFFYTQDSEGNNTYVSPTVENITGYRPEAWKKRKDWFITGAPINDRARAQSKAHLRGDFNDPRTLVEIRDAVGNLVLLETFEYPINRHGKQVGLQGVAHDITERKRAEEALRESEARCRKLSEAASEGIAISENGILVDGNSRLASMLGYKLDELIGRRLIDFVSFESRDLVGQQMAKHFEGEFEYSLLKNDGSLVPVSSHARVTNQQGRELLVTALLDLTERKRAEAETRQTDLRYHELIASMPVGHFKSTPEGRFVDVNPAFCAMVGYSEDELLNINIPETLYFDSRERKSRTHSTEFSPATETYRLKKKNGSEIWLEDFARDIPDRNGNVLYHEGLCIDVTGRRLAAEKEKRMAKETEIMNEISTLLLGSDEPYKRILDVCVQRCAEFIGDAASIFLYYPEDPYLQLAAACSRNQDAIDSFKEHFASHPVRSDKGSYGEVIASNQPKLISTADKEELLENADDSMRMYFSKVPLYSAMFAPLRDKGVSIGVLGMVRNSPEGAKYNEQDLRFLQDVADRAAMAISSARTYEALRDEVQQHKLAADQLRLQSAALNTAANGILITDKAGHILWTNRAFETVTGYSVQEILGRNPRELIRSGKQDQQFYRKMWATILSGKVWEGEIVNRRKDGTLHDEYMTIAPVLDEKGAIEHFIAVKQDITERKSLREMLAQSQKLESIGQLAGGVAHDYNNILGVIIGYAQLLRDRMGDDSRNRRSVDAVLAAASRGADLTRQLLAFARKELISPKVIELNQAIESIEKMLQRLIGENIGLEFTPGRNLWNTRIDRSQLDQILVNLAANSRDAIKGAGTISISTENIYAEEDYIESHVGLDHSEYVRVTFSDTGKGMDSETMEKVFEPFFTTKPRGQGTGLGLSTVYGIIKQNGGNILVESKVGKGTCFEIYFPRCLDEKKEEEQDLSELTARGTETILVVEDQADMLELAKSSLEKYGYKVMTAPGPEEALLLCTTYSNNIDILVTDVIMPVMSGRVLSEKVRAICPKMKTLFMSGYTANELDPEEVLIENVAFIQKPFKPSTMASKVRQVLDQ